jgi:putative Holliday junction resolvase
MQEAGRPGRKQRSVVDQVAAVIILQTALDAERRVGERAGELVTG